MKLLTGIIGMLLLTLACNNQAKEQSNGQTGENAGNPVESEFMHFVTVKKVIQTPTYTYLEVNDSEKEYWVAITKQEIQEGETFFYSEALEMKDFHSKALDRTFESILFLNTISKTGEDPHAGHDHSNPNNPHANMPNPHADAQHSGRKQMNKNAAISVEPAEGGVSIAQLFSDVEQYKGEKVKVRGQVVKVNNDIMGRNWVHIQDGSSANNKYDLTITTSDYVNEGDVVTFAGDIHLEKDFGAGYYYPVIMEDAEALK